MIDNDKRKAIFLLNDEGMSIKEIVKSLRVSRNTVRQIIAQKGSSPKVTRADRKEIDTELIIKLHAECGGYIQRVYEKLKEEEGFDVGYSTLTRLVRSLGLDESNKNNRRDSKVPDIPGQEMQHDTSTYTLKIGDHYIKVAGSSLYLRYSKMRYLKFYRFFTRFQMKCFFYESLNHFGYVANDCIIDNTNLAVYSGTGPNAVMTPEMIRFAKDTGDFNWKAHRIKHSDRKGGVESGFWFVETNFFPGRQFQSLEDLNEQALEWSTKRIVKKPHAKTKLIPVEVFEIEKSYLKKMPSFVPEPFLLHDVKIDQYGYAPLNANYYLVPGTGLGHVQILEYSDRVKILGNKEVVAEYKKPPFGIKGLRIPKDPELVQYRKKEPRSIQAEEIALRSIDIIIANYLNLLSKAPISSEKKHRSIKQLHSLSLKLSKTLLIKTLGRALKYEITSIDTVESIAVLYMREDQYQIDFESINITVDENTESRAIYREGELSEPPTFEKYDQLVENQEIQDSNIDKLEEDFDGQ